MSSWSEAEVNESLLGIEFVSSVEELINQKRNTGPFGGASIESTSVGEIMRKGREKKSQYKSQMSRLLPASQNNSEPYFARSVQVFLEDKYQRSNRFLVESYKIQLSIIPKDLNGFEYLCHPNLEKEEDFSRYFRSWQSTTLFSLCSLTQNAPIVRYFLAPLSETEREVSIELRKRFNLAVAVDEGLTSISQDPKPSSGLVLGSIYGPLEPLLSTRQDMRRIIVKMKFHVLNEFSQILNDLKSADKKQKLTLAPPLSNMTTAIPDPSVVRRVGHGQGRNRFFSEEIGEVGGFASRNNKQQDVNCSYKTTNDRNALGGTLGNRSVSNLFSNQEALRAVNQLSINNNSEEASSSFKSASSHRPFKLQENILEERLQQQMHRRRVSVGQNSLGEVSLTNFYRKNTDYITGVTTAAQAEAQRGLDGPVTEMEDDSMEDEPDDYKFGIGVNPKPGQPKGMETPISRRGQTAAARGLANIGTFLINEGFYKAELDEDDRVAEITNAVECAQMVAKGFHKVPEERSVAKEGTAFAPTLMVFNLPYNHSKDVEEYATLGDWLKDQRR